MENQAATGAGSNPENMEQATNPTIGENVHIREQSGINVEHDKETSTTPPITGALEALLGGLDTPSEDTQMKDAVESTSVEAHTQQLPMNVAQPASDIVQRQTSDIETLKEESKGQEEAPITNLASQGLLSERILQPDAPVQDVLKSDDQQMVDAPLPEGTPKSEDEPQTNNDDLENNVEEEHPEWEIDSSPIESSSEDSSSDDSSSEDSDEEGDDTYKLLSPEEQARILMEGDGGSDDESGNKAAKGSGGQLRTKNEVPEEVIPKPDVTITPEMPVQELGAVEAIVESILLIKAKISGEYRVLESGSVLCLADRTVIGAVSETLGRVQQPLYSVRFTNAGEITAAGLAVGTAVFYSEKHSNYVFTQALKAYKGSDASNLHDEEVGDEEVEFSDDEAEMEHKKRLKQRKLEKRGGKMQQNGGSSRGGHPLQQQHTPSSANMGLNYDDDGEDDGLYKPLSRPSGYANTMGRTEAPQEGAYSGNHGRSSNNARGDRGDFRGRGRGDRGRGRGDRGRGGDQGRSRGGGYQDRRNSNGYSLPPQDPANPYAQPPQSPVGNFPQAPSQSPRVPVFSAPGSVSNPYLTQQQEYSPLQPQMWPQFPPQPPGQQFPNMQNAWPNFPPPFPMPTGAFINPAFFSGNQYNPPSPHGQQNQHNQQNQPNQTNQQAQQNQYRGNGGGTQNKRSY